MYPHSERLSLSQRRCRLTQVKILECNNQENSTFPLDFPLSATRRTKFALRHTYNVVPVSKPIPNH